MNKPYTDKENIISLLLENLKETNRVRISREDITKTTLSEQRASQLIHIMQTDGWLRIVRKPNNNSFDFCWEIELGSSCIDYFKNQKAAKIQNRNNWIQFYIPVSISLLSVAIALLSLIMQLRK